MKWSTYAESPHIPEELFSKTMAGENWSEAFENSDIVLTCTVSSQPYINLKPKPGSLHLNISLRDYRAEFCNHVGLMIVDSWEEVCRENTDIEHMNKEFGLQQGDTSTLFDVKSKKLMSNLDEKCVSMFNPMGMAIFDVAIAYFFYQKSKSNSIGKHL